MAKWQIKGCSVPPSPIFWTRPFQLRLQSTYVRWSSQRNKSSSSCCCSETILYHVLVFCCICVQQASILITGCFCSVSVVVPDFFRCCFWQRSKIYPGGWTCVIFYTHSSFQLFMYIQGRILNQWDMAQVWASKHLLVVCRDSSS